MTAIFTLKLYNDLSTLDLMNATNYKVYDGGFNIGLPEVDRQLGLVRPGFYRPISETISYREASIQLDIVGTTRSDVLTNLRALQRLFRRTNSRDRFSVGRRMELQYAWEGASAITYFEVYSGDVNVPDDILQLEKIHYMRSGKYSIEANITMTVSSVGYGISIFSETLTEVPLLNGNVGAKQTGGLSVNNISPNNYAEIDQTDLPGAAPLITKIVVNPGNNYTTWRTMYIGHAIGPFSGGLLQDSSNTVTEPPGATHPAGGYGGYYTSADWGVGYSNPTTTATFTWNYSLTQAGIFYMFFHAFNAVPSDFQLAGGIDDTLWSGIRTRLPFVRPPGTTRFIPLGVINLPPTQPELATRGLQIDENLCTGIWVAKTPTTSTKTLTLDYISFLPCNGGLRIWQARGSEGIIRSQIDDDWVGVAYSSGLSGISENRVWMPFFTLLNPIKLEPGITQRLYFQSLGTEINLTERQRNLSVQVYVVPTWPTLAL